jgi:hypothetical protein
MLPPLQLHMASGEATTNAINSTLLRIPQARASAVPPASDR